MPQRSFAQTICLQRLTTFHLVAVQFLQRGNITLIFSMIISCYPIEGGNIAV